MKVSNKKAIVFGGHCYYCES